jgi:hypothetical protein
MVPIQFAHDAGAAWAQDLGGGVGGLAVKQSQGARLVKYIRGFWSTQGRGPTYLDLLFLGISTCPWKRLQEPGALAALKPGERIVRGKDAQGRVTFQITRRRT